MANKEKAPKPIIRKCPNCGKPLDEDKDFCLHCGETYHEKVKEKKPLNKALLKKIIIIVAIALVVAAIAGVIITLVIADMNESRYERMVDYIKDKGRRYVLDEGAVPAEESSSEGESEGESTEDTESEEIPEEVAIYKLSLDEETYIYCYEDAENTFYLCREIETKEYHIDDYEKPEDERRIVGEFIIDLEICITEPDESLYNEDEKTYDWQRVVYLWEASVEYDSYVGYQGYDFVRSYTGSMKPYDFTYLTGALKPDKLKDDDFVNPFYDVYSLYAELEGIELEIMLEDIVTAMNSACYELDDDSKIVPLLERAMLEMTEMLENEEIVDDYIRKFKADEAMKRFNDSYYALYPDKLPQEPEAGEEGDGAVEQELRATSVILMASSSSSKNDDEEDEEEDEGPKLPPSQEILAAAVDMLSAEACEALDIFAEHLEDNRKDVKVDAGEVGFVKYQEYLDSLIIEKR